ncbi:hypothetical protein [Rhizobium sp. Leaf391]|uniref:DUF6894 family protein n=1 Tax=Rhizobium sp. Leaf391 TaxID=1736360 RepID=UPI0012E3CC3B|nr:hypothetical protein [Rhizobium sp. Leaf391]
MDSMPVYFFHLKHSESIDEDLEGISFDTLDDARSNASDTLRDLVAENLRAAQHIDISGIEITDPSGSVVAMVSLEDAVLSRLTSEK